MTFHGLVLQHRPRPELLVVIDEVNPNGRFDSSSVDVHNLDRTITELENRADCCNALASCLRKDSCIMCDVVILYGPDTF